MCCTCDSWYVTLLSCPVLCHPALRCAVLCCAVMHCVALPCAVLHAALYNVPARSVRCVRRRAAWRVVYGGADSPCSRYVCTFTRSESNTTAATAQYHLQMNDSDGAFTGRPTAVFVSGDVVRPSGAAVSRAGQAESPR